MESHVTVSAKITRDIFERLEKLLAEKGMNKNEILRNAIETIVRYMDIDHNLTPEIEKAIMVFEHLRDWDKTINLADPEVDKVIGEATYFLIDKTGKKAGARAVHVTRPADIDGLFDEHRQWKQTYNIQDILEQTICLLSNDLYLQLRMVAVDMGCNSILELFQKLIDFHLSESDRAEMRKGFEDADRHEWGMKPNEGVAYKQRRFKTMDAYDRAVGQKQMSFDEYEDELN